MRKCDFEIIRDGSKRITPFGDSHFLTNAKCKPSIPSLEARSLPRLFLLSQIQVLRQGKPPGKRDSSAFWHGKACVIYESVFLKVRGRKVRKGTTEYVWKDKTLIIYDY